MNRYNDYIARTQQDRVLFDILYTLNEINEQLKNTKVTRNFPIIPVEEAPQIAASTPKPRKTTAKRGTK